MKIYVGNFSYEVTSEELQAIFEAFGRVESAKVIRDKFSGQSRGFGFVEMPDNREAQAAMQGITEIQGKRITINEARPQANFSSGGFKSGFKSGFKGGFKGGPKKSGNRRDNNYGRRERQY